MFGSGFLNCEFSWLRRRSAIISNETCAYVRCNAVGLAGMPNPSAFRLRDVLAVRANNVDILVVSDTVELPSLPVPVGLIPAARGTRERVQG